MAPTFGATIEWQMKSSVLLCRIREGARVKGRLHFFSCPYLRKSASICGLFCLWLACFFSSVSMAQDTRLSEQDARLNRAYQQRVTQLSRNPQKLAELRRQELDWIK